MTTNWKYTTPENKVVFRILENGAMESCLVEAIAEWLAEGNTPEPADPPPAPDYSALRAQAYRDESDPLFFKAQRGEATMDEWKAKVAEIKGRWPA